MNSMNSNFESLKSKKVSMHRLVALLPLDEESQVQVSG